MALPLRPLGNKYFAALLLWSHSELHKNGPDKFFLENFYVKILELDLKLHNLYSLLTRVLHIITGLYRGHPCSQSTQ